MTGKREFSSFDRHRCISLSISQAMRRTLAGNALLEIPIHIFCSQSIRFHSHSHYNQSFKSISRSHALPFHNKLHT